MWPIVKVFEKRLCYNVCELKTGSIFYMYIEYE